MSNNVYIMPVGPMSAVTYYALNHSNNTEDAITVFLDNAKGKVDNAFFCDRPVSIPESIDRNAKIIVATLNYTKPITRQLLEMGFTNVIDAKSFLTLADATVAMQRIQQDGIVQRHNLVSIERQVSSFFVDSQADNEQFTLARLEFVVTQRCTLKCKDCCLLMPYFTNPCDMDIEIIIRSADEVFKRIDYIRALAVLGGEPLLIKGLPQIFNKLVEYRERIGQLILMTNGTLMANDETLSAMKRARARLVISDYGSLSKNKDALILQAQQAGVDSEVKTANWWPKASFSSENTNSEKVFKTCDEFCSQMLDGRLYYCGFAAQADALRGFPDNADNYVNLFDPKTTRTTIRRYMERTRPLPACGWCTGGDVTREPIPAAVQTAEPLQYKRYD